MDVYKLTYNSELHDGVFAMSLVEEPATGEMFFTFSQEEKKNIIEKSPNFKFEFLNEEKGLIAGTALVPDQMIYRNVDGYEFYMTIDAPTIEQLAHDFLKKGNQSNTTLEHETPLEGMTVVESFIDRSGGEKNGAWNIIMKADNKEAFELAKQGTIKGFSVEGLGKLEKINLSVNKNPIEMDNETLFAKIKGLFSLNEDKPKEEVKAEDVEVQAEEVQAVETPTEVVEEPTDEVKEFEGVTMEQITEAVEAAKVEMSKQTEKQISELTEKHKSEIEARDKQIEELKIELSKQPEKPGVKKGQGHESRKSGVHAPNQLHNRQKSIHEAIAEQMGW